MTHTNDTTTDRAKSYPKAPQAADWALSHGKSAYTTGELAELLGTTSSQVSWRLASAVKRSEWIKPTKGLWVAVPPEYRAWGAPPASEFLNQMMQYLDVEYYLGWLSAAAMYGSAHHAPQVVQVATAEPVRERTLGRSRIRFFTRSNIANLPVIERTVRSGRVRVSTPEVTALDLCSDLELGAGIDNVATVIEGLAEERAISVKQVLPLIEYYSPAAVRRLGWLLETFTKTGSLDRLVKAAAAMSNAPSDLDCMSRRAGSIDKRWILRINTEVESEH
jgi:predicted transcriptional regulator of viral defense system